MFISMRFNQFKIRKEMVMDQKVWVSFCLFIIPNIKITVSTLTSNLIFCVSKDFDFIVDALNKYSPKDDALDVRKLTIKCKKLSLVFIYLK